MLDAEASLLHEKAEQLLATGAASIEWPAGLVTARFRTSRWRRRGVLAWRRRPERDIEAVTSDDSGRRACAYGPMTSKYGDRAALVNEITLTLAIHLAWLKQDQ